MTSSSHMHTDIQFIQTQKQSPIYLMLDHMICRLKKKSKKALKTKETLFTYILYT